MFYLVLEQYPAIAGLGERKNLRRFGAPLTKKKKETTKKRIWPPSLSFLIASPFQLCYHSIAEVVLKKSRQGPEHLVPTFVIVVNVEEFIIVG